MDDDYSFRPGGTLKLKGPGDGKVKKKKKYKTKLDEERVKESLLLGDSSVIEAGGSAGNSGRNSPKTTGNSSGAKTEAEKRFEEIQRKRLEGRVAKLATKTHKDRVHEFNAKLEALSEHHDIPKVGPG